jgi:gluconolactonase
MPIECVLAAALLAGVMADPKTAHNDLPKSRDVTPQLYATGFEFADGPALDAAGNLYVVNYRGVGTIGRIKPDGTAGIFCDLLEAVPVDGKQPQANGLKIDAAGRLVAADSGVGRLLRISIDGKKVTVLADRWEGKTFRSVNDLALDRSGNIYFTDPGGSTLEKPIGAIYRYDISTTKVTRLDTGLVFPNGIGVTPDQKHLCVCESLKYRVLIYDFDAKTGKIINRRTLIAFPLKTVGEIKGGKFEPDGMIFDAQGRMYVAMWTSGVVNVVDVVTGKLIRQYDAGGSQATNVHFHKGYLYTTVAAKEAVFRLKLGVAGFEYIKRK